MLKSAPACVNSFFSFSVFCSSATIELETRRCPSRRRRRRRRSCRPFQASDQRFGYVCTVGPPRHWLLPVGAEIDCPHAIRRGATIVRGARVQHAIDKDQTGRVGVGRQKGNRRRAIGAIVRIDRARVTIARKDVDVVRWPTAQPAATAAAASRRRCRRTWSGASTGWNRIVRRGARPPCACATSARLGAPLPGSPTELPDRPPRPPPAAPPNADTANDVGRVAAAIGPPGQAHELFAGGVIDE